MDNSETPPFAERLNYQIPSAMDSRPGILTAVGVISIVLGSMGALTSAYSLFSALVFHPLQRMLVPVRAPATAPIVVTTVNGSTVTTSVTAYSTRTRVPARVVPFSIPQPNLGVTLGTEGMGGLLAILLFVAGILIFRNAAGAARLHWIYVWVKIPLVIASAVAMWFWYTQFFAAMGQINNGGGAFPPGMVSAMALGSAAITSVISLVYPVAMICVLSSRRAKAYLAATF